jgi:cell division protein FtsB
LEEILMAIIGLLLLLLALALVIGVVVDNNVQVVFDVFGTTIDDLTVAGLFVAGVLTGLIGVVGLWMMKVGAARSRRRRLQQREERERERSSIEQLAMEREQLEAEKAQLEAQLQRERGRAAAARPAEPDRRILGDSDSGSGQRPPDAASDPRRGEDRPAQPTA